MQRAGSGRGKILQTTRGCPRIRQEGTLNGNFRMGTGNGETLDARIEPFRLAMPSALN